MKNKFPRKCPVCDEPLIISELTCPNCGVKIQGKFDIPNLLILTDEQMRFLQTFLVARGNIKEVGKRLNISYPTVKNRLDNLIDALGLKAPKNEKSLDELLDDLEAKKTTVDEIVNFLKRR
ncbi:DUF2089 domain-containing protein [candidate division WOR-3 bacterium]|nr:DUF2089 domain-containing protein [candidate division WOR-3 bacterium]